MAGMRDMARDWVTDVFVALRFFTRLPAPKLPWEDDPHGRPDFARAARAVPVVGLVVGVVAGAVLIAAYALGLPPMVIAVLVVATQVVATGCFHEDGLADTADGLGGGHTVERKLEIMKDSRIGSYGGAALMLALIARVVVVAGLVVAAGGFGAAGALVAAAALSRTSALWLGYALPAARVDGAAFGAGRPSETAFGTAVGLAFLIALGAAGLGAAVGGVLVGGVVAYLMGRLAMAQIGGQTGDIAGATQQLVEIAVLVVVLRLWG